MKKTKKTGRPWYRKGRDSWFVWHAGRQVFLAKGRGAKAEAYAKFAELLDGPKDPEPAARIGVAELIHRYEAAARVKPETLISYRSALRPFVREFGGRDPGDLDPDEVVDWSERRKWSPTTRRFALTVVGTAFRWAEGEGLVPANPLRKLPKPPGRSRGADVLIDAELHAKILSVASPEFRDFLEAVRATGARPGEIARVEARHVRWDAGCAILDEHKTDRTGRVRVVYIPELVLPLFRRLAGLRPTGVLFRPVRGSRWRKTSWLYAMKQAQRKLGLGRRPMLSGQRHSFATDALAAGVPDAVVAELLGHSGTAMIARHYGHLSAKAAALRAALAVVRGGGGHPAPNGTGPGTDPLP
jgi:integrase